MTESNEGAVAAPHFVETARAPGAWTCLLRAGSIPFRTIRDHLMAMAIGGPPINACVYTSIGKLETLVLLYRHPSAKRGTPEIPDCAEQARMLAAWAGWPVLPVGPTKGVLVPLGLQEGFEPDAPVHQVEELERMLDAHDEDDAICHPARLVSARDLPERGEVRWRDERGAMVLAPPRTVPALAHIAAALRQDRFSVTDIDAAATYALKHQPHSGGRRA